MRFPGGWWLLGLLAAACGDGPGVPTDGLLPLGTWGGKGAGVIVTESVTHVHIGCTLGDIPGRLALDAEGRFSVPGEYVLQAYPVAVGPPMPAVFSGRLQGRRLTITVARQLRAIGARWGIASACVGGGQGIALLVENPEAA